MDPFSERVGDAPERGAQEGFDTSKRGAQEGLDTSKSKNTEAARRWVEEHKKVWIRRKAKKRAQQDDGLSELVKEQDGGGDAPKSKMVVAARRWVEGTKERI